MAEITALGATLLHSLWQATLLAFLLWSVSRYGTLGAAGRYRVAYGMLLLQLALSAATFLYYYTPAPRLESSVKQVVIAFVGFSPTEVPTYHRFTDPEFWMTALVGCWLLAMVVGSVRLGTSFWRVRRMQRLYKDAVVPQQVSSVVRRLARRLGWRGSLRIHVGAGITTPMLVGHLKPVLLFPLALVNQLSTEEAETVILHELAHLRRYDHYFNLLQCLIEVLYYYHPAVHWIGARVREEREYCCDDLVLAYGPGKLPYARALLHYGEQSGGQPATALSLTDGGGLLARVRRLIDHQELSYTMNTRLLLLPLLALFCLVATAAYAPLADEKSGEDITPLTTDIAPAGLALLDTVPPEVLENMDSLRQTAEQLIERMREQVGKEGYPAGWDFDFSPDSLHRMALRSLESINFDSILDAARVTLEEIEFDTFVYMHPLDRDFDFRTDHPIVDSMWVFPRPRSMTDSVPVNIMLDIPSLEREERRLKERLEALKLRKKELLEEMNEGSGLLDGEAIKALEKFQQRIARLDSLAVHNPTVDISYLDSDLGRVLAKMKQDGVIEADPIRKLEIGDGDVAINGKSYGRSTYRYFRRAYKLESGTTFPGAGTSISIDMDR